MPGGFPAAGGPQHPGGYPGSAGPAGGYPGSAGPAGGYQGTSGPAGGYAGGWDQARSDQARSEQDTGPIPRVGGLPGAPGAATRRFDPAKLLGLTVAVLGALNFIWGFLPEITSTRSNESLSVFAVGPAYVPVLLLIAGLLALAAFLPGSERSRLAVAAVSVGGAAGAIVSLGTEGSVELVSATSVGKGLGAILLVIFGIVQAVVAIGAYVIGADLSQVRGPRTQAAAAGGNAYAVPAASAGLQAAWGAAPAPGGPGGSAEVRPGWYGPTDAGARAPVPGSPAGQSAQPGSYPAAPSGAYPAAAANYPNMPAADESDTGPQPVVDVTYVRAAGRPVDSPPEPTVATTIPGPAAESAASPPAPTGAPAGPTSPAEAADLDNAAPATHSAAAGEPDDQGRTVVLRSPLAGSEESSDEEQRRS